MVSEKLVVAQTKAHLVCVVGMAAVLAVAGILVVQRPLIESYPAGLFIAAIFTVMGLEIFTSRLILEGQVLSQRRYGRELWRVDLAQARFGEIIDDAGWSVFCIEVNGRRIGKMRSIYFDPKAFQRLLERIAEIQEPMPDKPR